MLSKSFYAAAVAAVVLPVLVQGCSAANESNPLCCNEFQVGGTVKAEVSGSASGKVVAQAVADFSGIAAAAVDDVTTACRGIAQDLEAPRADQEACDKNTDKHARLEAWCALAVKTIGTVKASASASIKVDVAPPKCEASVSAKANCQAQCSGSASCDIKANPPTCTGGKLEVACKGECTAKAGATLTCEGKCSAACKGSCTAQGGVECAGRCDGACSVATDSQGKCNGTCNGTCEVTAPGVTCNGSCTGECSGSCTGSANASVKCDGECKADYEPISCKGGKLEGGCKVDAKCDASCNASVQAKAECTPPEVRVVISGTADANVIGKLTATLESNLKVVYALQSRVEAIGDIGATLEANVSLSTLGEMKTACIPPIAAAVAAGVDDLAATGDACGKLSASVK